MQKPTSLSSDHFNFNIRRLVELGYVEKASRGQYQLTIKGKEYANRLDTDEHTIERQPKVAVMLGVKKDIKGQAHYLFQQRTKNPYYGYWGFPTGKIRWGETIFEAAARELMEESGLYAKVTKIKGVYHEHIFIDDDPEAKEDKMFYLILCSDLSGSLIEVFEGGRNAWYDPFAAKALSPKYDSFDLEFDFILGNITDTFVEKSQHYNKQQF